MAIAKPPTHLADGRYEIPYVPDGPYEIKARRGKQNGSIDAEIESGSTLSGLDIPIGQG